jgi:hypothetical protein
MLRHFRSLNVTLMCASGENQCQSPAFAPESAGGKNI